LVDDGATTCQGSPRDRDQSTRSGCMRDSLSILEPTMGLPSGSQSLEQLHFPATSRAAGSAPVLSTASDYGDNWINSTRYNPNQNGWLHIIASRAEFSSPPRFPIRANTGRSFRSSYPHAADQRNYECLFDNIQLATGPLAFSDPSKPNPSRELLPHSSWIGYGTTSPP